jgi:hypothetical protein
MIKPKSDDKSKLSRRGFLIRMGLLVPAASIGSLLQPQPSKSGRETISRKKPSLPKRHRELWWSRKDGRFTIYSAPLEEKGIPLCWLNDTGAEAWKRIDGKHDPAQITEEVARRLGFEAKSEDIYQTTRFLIKLDKLGLLEGPCVFRLDRSEVKRI